MVVAQHCGELHRHAGDLLLTPHDETDAGGTGLRLVLLLGVEVDQLPVVFGQRPHGLIDQDGLEGLTEVVRLLAGKGQQETVAILERDGSRRHVDREHPLSVQLVGPDEALPHGELGCALAAVLFRHLQEDRHER